MGASEEPSIAELRNQLERARAVNASLNADNVRLLAENNMLRSAVGIPAPESGPIDAPTGSEEKLRIFLNTNITMSRGKAAAHAVHAALTAFGVHHGGPVIVLGAKPRDIEKMRVAIHDEGHTELAPGTLTAGTDWSPIDHVPVKGTTQYRAVWPGGMVSMDFPSPIPLREEAERRSIEIGIETRTALYTPWELQTEIGSTPVGDSAARGKVLRCLKPVFYPPG
jgi:PTH2 family peptidyl-tRNA hydrolase